MGAMCFGREDAERRLLESENKTFGDAAGHISRGIYGEHRHAFLFISHPSSTFSLQCLPTLHRRVF